MVTADRWLQNRSGARLRAVLGARMGIAHLRRLDTSSPFYSPKTRAKNTPPRVHPVEIVLCRAARLALTAAPVFPDAVAASPIAAADTLYLGDVAEIRMGPWLGRRGRFVVDAAAAQQLPAEHLVRAVHTREIVDGCLPATAQAFAIRTRPGTPPPPAIAQHLAATAHLMPQSKHHRREWLPPETWHDLDLTRPALLLPRTVRYLRPAHLPAGMLHIDHSLAVVATGPLSLGALERALASDHAQNWLRRTCPRIDGGFYALSKTALQQMPLPAALDAAAPHQVGR